MGSLLLICDYTNKLNWIGKLKPSYSVHMWLFALTDVVRLGPVFWGCSLSGLSWENGQRGSARKLSLLLLIRFSPPAKRPLFCSNTWFMQIKAWHVEHEVTASEDTASDEPSVVFDMQGAWIAICVSTEARPKQKEIFPELSRPGWGTWAEEETKRQEQELGPDPQWGVETCNYTSQQMELPFPLAQNTDSWNRSSRFRSFCVGPRVWFLYLLYRKHISKSPVLAARLNQAIPIRHNRSS